MNNTTNTKATMNLTISGILFAIGLVLPFFTGQIPQIGSMLLPMHIPVFLCAFICGWKYGITLGFVLPILRSMVFGMPPLYPIAIAMSFELASYGFAAGFLYEHSRVRNVIAIYRSMIISMILGRVVWGIAQVILLGIQHSAFTWQMFIAGALIKAIPGIIVQLILIPVIMVALNRTGLVPYNRIVMTKTQTVKGD